MSQARVITAFPSQRVSSSKLMTLAKCMQCCFKKTWVIGSHCSPLKRYNLPNVLRLRASTYCSRFKHFSYNSRNELNYCDSKLIFSLKEKNFITSEEVLTTGSSPCPLMKTVVYPDKCSDTITSKKTSHIRVRVQQVGAINNLQDLTVQ